PDVTGRTISRHVPSSRAADLGAFGGGARGDHAEMRSNLLDTLRAEFVTSARAKGLPERWVIYKHALRNAINPLLTIFGYSLAELLSGDFIVENIMAWPGLGRLTMEAFFAQDYQLVVATVVMATTLL